MLLVHRVLHMSVVSLMLVMTPLVKLKILVVGYSGLILEIIATEIIIQLCL